MAVNRKNLRYCEVLYSRTTYGVLVAVASLDEIDNILQEWAINKFGAGVTLDLPSALVVNKDITEVLTSVTTDNFAYLQSPVAAYMDMPRYTGISGDLPVFPEALVGGFYKIPTCMAFLWSEPDFQGYFGEYIVPESQNFTLASGANYFGISFNTGSPIYVQYNSLTPFDYSSIIPVVTVLNFGTDIFVIPAGQSGYGLPEKNTAFEVRKNRLEILDSYTLAVTNRYVQLGALAVRSGLQEIDCLAVDTSIALNDMYLHYRDGSSVWQNTKVTQLNNTQYQGSGSGLVSLAGVEVVINNIYRVVDNGKLLLFNVLSGKFANLQLAIDSNSNVDVPDLFKGTAVHVGRIVMQYNVATPVAIQTVQKTPWGVV